MNLRRDLRDGARIGRAEATRSVRRQLGSTRRVVGMAVAVLFLGGNFLFALPAVYALGRTAESLSALPYLGGSLTLVPVGLLLLAGLRTLERIAASDQEALLLTTVHHRAVVVGLVLAELFRLAAWFGPPLVALLVAFALGVGSASLPFAAPVVAVPVVAWTAVWGYALGLAVLRALRRLPGVRRVLKVVGVVAMIGLIVASQFVGPYLVEGDVSLESILDTLAFAPLVDYVALAFVGTRLGGPITPAAVGVLAALVVSTPLGLAVATRQASSLWFTDVHRSSDTSAAPTSSGDFTAPRPFAWRKSGRIAWGLLVRGIRNPGELSHLVMVLFFIGPLATTVVQSSGDALGALVAGTGVGLGTYLAGATFGLNPLGEDRPQLPLLLLTPTTPATLVRGRVLAGLAVGVPVAVLVSLASLALGSAPTTAVALAAVGAAMCLAAALFAVGLGATYPVYTERKFWGTETVVPSMLVMFGYIFVVGGGTVVGLVTTWFAVTGNLTLTPVSGVGIGVYLLLTVGISYGAYRYAHRRYRRFAID
ncbi:hypothetical protein [Natronomonas marina]|uniref:hypothetical protein n=1 Tax=Natronomonas marina TaxID=2961939 RepID=UPI0020C95CD5|nr:hypothetical protein [Natronomonas marina]